MVNANRQKTFSYLKFDALRTLLVVGDIGVVGIALFISYLTFFGRAVPEDFVRQGFFSFLFLTFINSAVFGFARVYSRKIPIFGRREIIQVLLASLLSFLLFFFIEYLLPSTGWPLLLLVFAALFFMRASLGLFISYFNRSITPWIFYTLTLGGAICLALLISPILEKVLRIPGSELPVSKSISLLYFFFSSLLFLILRKAESLLWSRLEKNPGAVPVVVYGAGKRGLRFIRIHAGGAEFSVAAMIDDNPVLHGVRINRVQVLGGLGELGEAIRNTGARAVILAVENLPLRKKTAVLDICQAEKIRMFETASLGEIVEGKVEPALNEISYGELLGREQYRFDPQQEENYLQGRCVLVTGAGGSIGSELCRQLAFCGVSKILLLGKGENSIFLLDRELRENWPDCESVPIIASVTDIIAVDAVMEKYAPSLVFHAAAHKHVPLMEQNVREAWKNNVQGTLNVAKACCKHGVERFVMVSTDKAVVPESVMGASKRLAETEVEWLSRENSAFEYRIVRFGNVLGSRGSVVPIFQQQILSGGPVTVTHRDMERFFMSIPEAVSLLLRSAGFKNSGTFVLRMGRPVSILKLAESLIARAGLRPYKDIEIRLIGARPGEKISEILVDEGERLLDTEAEKVQAVEFRDRNWSAVRVALDKVGRMMENTDVLEDEMRLKLLDVSKI